MKSEIYERLKEIGERIKKEYNAEKVILYGSYARGEATEDSDIDLLIIARTDERMFERMATVLEIVHDLYDNLPLSPIVLSPEELQERLRLGDQFIKGVIEEGVEL